MSKRLSWLITGGVLALFAVYFAFNVSKFELLLSINSWLLVLIAIINVISIILNGFFIKIVLVPFGKLIDAAEAVYVSLISSVANFFASTGAGMGFRAVYLKKKHNLPYSDFVTMLYGNYVIVFLVSSLVALLSLFVLRNNQSGSYFALLTVFGAIFGISLLVCFIRVPKVSPAKYTGNKHLNVLAKTFVRIAEGWNSIIANRQLLLKLIGLVTANFVSSVLTTKLIILSLHLDISLPALLLFSVLGSLSIFVNITPANLGVKEAIYLFSGQVIGFSAEEILSIALIDRGVMFVTLAALWLFSAKSKAVQRVTK